MATAVRPYTRYDIPMDFSVSGLGWALGMLGYSSPVLHVHPEGFIDAYYIVDAMKAPIGIVSDPSITDMDEWWVEWNGKAYGSEGC